MYCSLTCLKGHVEELLLNHLHLGNGKCQIHERLKSDTNFITVWALHGRFILTVH